jgi:hypothetical protein
MKIYKHLLSVLIGISSFNLHAGDINTQDKILIYNYAHIDKNNSYQTSKDLATSNDEPMTYKVPSLALSGGKIIPSKISAQTSCFIEPNSEYFNPSKSGSYDIKDINKVIITPKVLEVIEIVYDGTVKYVKLKDINPISGFDIIDFKLICVRLDAKSNNEEYTLDTSVIQSALKGNDKLGTSTVIAEFLEKSKYDTKIIDRISKRRNDSRYSNAGKDFSGSSQKGLGIIIHDKFFKNLYL